MNLKNCYLSKNVEECHYFDIIFIVSLIMTLLISNEFGNSSHSDIKNVIQGINFGVMTFSAILGIKMY